MDDQTTGGSGATASNEIPQSGMPVKPPARQAPAASSVPLPMPGAGAPQPPATVMPQPETPPSAPPIAVEPPVPSVPPMPSTPPPARDTTPPDIAAALDAVQIYEEAPAPNARPLSSVKPSPAPAPAASGNPASVEAQPGPLRNDIDKILAGIKLPERRDMPAAKPDAAPKTYDTSLGAAVAAADKTEPDIPAIVTPKTGNPSSPTDVAAVHTLKNDLQQVVRVQKMSLVRAVSLEQDRKAHEDVETREVKAHRSQRAFGIVFASVLLLFLGAAALFGVYLIMNQRSGSPAQQPSSTILFAESSVALPLADQTPSSIKSILASARSMQTGTLGSITRIVPLVPDGSAAETGAAQGTPALRPATFSEFMRAIGASVPDALLRALSDDFFLGIHTVDQNAPVIVVPVISYDRAFAGMLAWEKTMNADLAPAFTAVPVLARDEQGIPAQRTFSDLVMRNYDVRALKDDSGTIRLYYSFPVQGILVIAESPYSFPEILSRLQAQRKL